MLRVIEIRRRGTSNTMFCHAVFGTGAFTRTVGQFSEDT